MNAKSLFATTALCAALAVQARAQTSIHVRNHGFELNGHTQGSWQYGAADWAFAPAQGGGCWHPQAGSFVDGAPEGLNSAFLNVGTLLQETDELAEANTRYRLRVQVGRRADMPFASYLISLSAGAVQGPVVANVAPAAGGWIDVPLEWAVLPGDAAVGQPLTIRIESTGPQVNFDDVRLLRDEALHVPGEFATIQGAIDAALDGETILIESGTYVENLDLRGKRITLEGVGDSRPVIDGGGQGTVVLASSGETEETVLRNLRIQNGSANGLRCVNANPTLEHCEFVDNDGYNGGAIFANGLEHTGGPMQIGNCLFAGNEAQVDGGAISTSMDLLIEGCTFTRNIASPTAGGAIYGWSSELKIDSAIVWNNWPNQFTMLGGATCLVENAIVQGGWTGPGHGIDVLDQDPRFVNPLGDSRLQADSPAIDRGRIFDGIELDLDLQPRVYDDPTVPNASVLPADLGAYEFNNSIGTSYCLAAPNSVSAQGSRITVVGSNNLWREDVTLYADNAPDQPGLYYFGPQTAAAPFGDGVRCVGGTVVRMDVVFGSGGLFEYTVDFQSHGAQLPLGTVHFQCWYRDPAAGGTGFNLSDGYSVDFIP